LAKSCQNGGKEPHLLAVGVLWDKSFTKFCWERLGAVCFDNPVQQVVDVVILHMTILEVLKPRKAQVVEGDVENAKSIALSFWYCPPFLEQKNLVYTLRSN
jgi:hypothetical protein